MGIAAEGMTDQDDVVTPRGELAVGLVRHANREQVPPAVEPHRFRQLKVFRLDRAD